MHDLNNFLIAIVKVKRKKFFENQQKLLCFSDAKIDQTLKFFRKSFRCAQSIIDNANEC